MEPAPFQASNTPLPFYWRGRAFREGEMMWLESGCTGEVVFLGGGKIMGLIGDLKFTSILDAKMEGLVRSVKDMENERKGYNEKTHVREEVGLWGGWHEV